MVTPTRSKLTAEEIHTIEARSKEIGGETRELIQRLIRSSRWQTHAMGILKKEAKERKKEITNAKPRHYCPDWDFLQIYSGWGEMEACTCDFSVQHLWDRIGVLEKEIEQYKAELLQKG